jgi:tetratricopeptide (TPR) repeat protein
MTNSEILNAINNDNKEPARNFTPLILFVATAFLFLAVGAQRWSLERALLLLAALFVHECGHLAAMKAYNYKNLKMLFIPFLGAVASGKPEEHDAYKIAVISIFGPLFGLVGAAAAMLVWMLLKSDVLVEFAYLSVLLNAFNLLPIMPLDGGHFFNETLFAKYPKVELGFKIAAVIALFWLAAAKRFVGSGVIGVLLLMSLQLSYKMAAAINKLRSEEGMSGGSLTEEKVGRIRTELEDANPQLISIKFATKLPSLIAGTWAKINKVFPGPRKVALLFAIYTAIAFCLVPLEFKFARGIRSGSFAAAHITRGNAKMQGGDFAGAISEYNRALALAPNNPAIFIIRGAAETLNGDSDAGVADLNRGLALRPNDVVGDYYLGLAKLGKRDYAGAIANLDTFIRLKPDIAYSYKNRGNAERMIGRLEDAHRDFDKAIFLNPNDGETWWDRGFVKDLGGDFKGAAVDYGKAAQLLPKEGFVRFRLALTLRRQHIDDDRARLRLEIPQIKDPWIKAVGTYLAGDLTDTAFLTHSIDKNPKIQLLRQCQSYYYIGMMHLLRNDATAARDAFGKCVAIGSQDSGEFRLANAELARLKSD